MRTGSVVPSALTRSMSKRRVSPWRSAAAGSGDERGAVFRHDLGELELAAGDVGKVEAEPLGERGVEIVDGAVAVGGEEAGRRVVEIGDGLLHLLEAGLLPLAVGGHLVDLPDHEPAFAA